MRGSSARPLVRSEMGDWSSIADCLELGGAGAGVGAAAVGALLAVLVAVVACRSLPGEENASRFT